MLAATLLAVAPVGEVHADVFGSCVERALALAKDKGAKVFGRPRDTFLIAPDPAVVDYTLPADGCLGFVFAGRRHSQGVWLTLYGVDGRPLAAKRDAAVYGYLRACGSRGDSIAAEVRMREGGGEVRLQAIWNAPAALEGLALVMDGCRGVGVPRPPLVDVGPQPIGLSMAGNLERLTSRLAQRGYRRVGEAAQGDLPNMRRDIRRITLAGDRCYALAAVGGPDVIDIDLRVFDSEESPRLVSSEAVRGQEAIVKLCAEQAGDRLIDIRMYEGGGPYLLQAYELPLPNAPRPAGAAGATLIGLKESEVRFESRGLQIRQATWLLLPARDGQRVPVSLGPGCHGFALVPAAGPPGATLHLSVTDGEGNLLASDVGGGEVPVAFTCSSQPRVHGVLARAPSSARPQQALLVVAEDAP